MGAPDGGSRAVLIVGAGPTGLALALWLARLSVGLRQVTAVNPLGHRAHGRSRSLSLFPFVLIYPSDEHERSPRAWPSWA